MAVVAYKVYITPLFNMDTYEAEDGIHGLIDITNYVAEVGLGEIEREADKGDYLVGVYGYGTLKLTCINFDGRFNHESAVTSGIDYFRFSRDRCKVKVEFLDSSGGVLTTFRGLINEEDTKQDWQTARVDFIVLSNDSILRKIPVSAGSVGSGQLFSDAIKSLLNKPRVTAVLNYNPANINVDLDLVVDDGAKFDVKNIKDALNDLLSASNSVMVVDASNNVYVRSRTENANIPWKFYGESDLLGRTNIIFLNNYNSGLHRAFNQASVNEVISTHTTYVDRYGLRNTEIKYDFLTDGAKAAQIGARIVNTFAQPKHECEITCTTDFAKNIELFDKVTVFYPPRFAKDPTSDHIPLFEIDSYDAGAMYPIEVVSLTIEEAIIWKVIGIYHDPGSQLTRLRIREAGVSEITYVTP